MVYAFIQECLQKHIADGQRPVGGQGKEIASGDVGDDSLLAAAEIYLRHNLENSPVRRG